MTGLRIVLVFFSIVVLSCSCNSVGKEPGINGLTEAEIKAKYGEPTHELIIPMTKNKSLPEYESDLYAIVPLNDGDTLLVKEMYWEGNTKNKVVWLKIHDGTKWLSFDNLQWSKDVNF